MEIVGVILAYVYYPNIRQAALDTMPQYNKAATTTEGQSITTGWDAVQLAVSQLSIKKRKAGAKQDVCGKARFEGKRRIL